MALTAGWKFTPRPWPTLAALVTIPAMIALGQWQLDRAAAKQRSHDQFVQRRAVPVRQLDPADPEVWKLAVMRYRGIEARGRYDAGMNLLLDNQIMDGAVGYLVYTPFLLDGAEAYILVNRGWVPAGPDRRAVPEIATPAGVLSLSGVAALPPPPGIRMGDNIPEPLAPNYVRLQRIEMEHMMQEYSGKLMPYELRLDPAAPSGFVRKWPQPGSGRERHLGYAFQWFAMAGAVAILYVVLNIRRGERRS